MIDPIRDFLAARIEAGDTPSASWCVTGPERIIAEGVLGHAVLEPHREPATPDTLYDLASLTKPLVTAALTLLLGRELGMRREDSIVRYLPELDRMRLKPITLQHLMTHTSGLPAWMPLYISAGSLEGYLRLIRDAGLQAGPGAQVIYSDLGYMLLGEALARCATMSLDALARQAIFTPLGLGSTLFTPGAARKVQVAATEDSCKYERRMAGDAAARYTGWRGGIIRGEVHDQNAWALGGVAGHAGLFSTARETARIAGEYLGWGCSMLDGESRRLAAEDLTPGLAESRSIAFRVALRGETAAGPALSPESFGHNGFTGTSVWIDPRRQRVHVLLTNRVHPVATDAVDMQALRRGFHAAAVSFERPA